MAFFVNPCLVIRAHHVHVHALAINAHNGVVFDGEANGVAQVAFEGEIHIAWRHDQSAIDTASSRKGQSQTSRPMRHHAWLGTKAPNAPHHSRLELNVQISANFRSDMHVLCSAKFFHGIAHHSLKCRIGHGAFQNFRVLVGNHEQARHDTICAFQDCG